MARVALAFLLSLTLTPRAWSDDACHDVAAAPFGIEEARADSVIRVLETVEADASGAPLFCVPCSEEDVTEVDLRIKGEAEENEGFGMSGGVDSTFDSNHPSGSVGLELRLVDPSQIASILRRFSQSCVRVRQLTFVAHGDEGALWLDQTPLQGSNLRNAFPDGADCVFQPGANIDIESCSSAYGCDGTMLLADLARRTLTKGGTVSGNTSLGLMLRFLPIPMFPLNAETQTLTLDGEGKIVSATSETCRDEIALKLGDLAIARRRVRGCVLSDAAKKDWKALREAGAALFEIRALDLASHADILNYWGGHSTRGLFDYEGVMAQFWYSLGDLNAALDEACPR